MTTTISLSLTNILDRVYAHTAAQVVSTGSTRPEILGRAHADMLKVIVRDSIAGLAYTVAHLITDSNIAQLPIPEIIYLEMSLPDDISQQMLCSALETAVAAGTLAQAWSGSDGPMAARYGRAYEISLETLRRTAGKGIPGKIAPTA